MEVAHRHGRRQHRRVDAGRGMRWSRTGTRVGRAALAWRRLALDGRHPGDASAAEPPSGLTQPGQRHRGMGLNVLSKSGSMLWRYASMHRRSRPSDVIAEGPRLLAAGRFSARRSCVGRRAVTRSRGLRRRSATSSAACGRWQPWRPSRYRGPRLSRLLHRSPLPHARFPVPRFLCKFPAPLPRWPPRSPRLPRSPPSHPPFPFLPSPLHAVARPGRPRDCRAAPETP